MLEGTTPIDAPKHNFKNFDAARKWAKENIVGTYKNEDTGEDIYASKNSIDKYLSQKAVEKSANRDAHLSALKQLPQLIKTSIRKETEQDRANSENIKEIQRFYGAIKYEGQTYPVKITVKATKREGNKAYSYEVMEIESPVEQNLPGQSTSDGNLGDRMPSTNGLSPISGFSSTAIDHPLAESRQPAAENRSSVATGKDTKNSSPAK